MAECLRSGAWNGLEPAELAAVLSAVLYESRGDAPGAPQGYRRADRQTATCAEPDPRAVGRPARADEQRHRITASREPDDGFVTAIYRWATTGDLTSALAASDVPRAGGTSACRRAGLVRR